jgi:hypothetical protein
MGQMSLVGPRPLLPLDQPPDYSARLAVRPGLTGWAQVNGGRIISSSDKWILDVWYVNNASLLLDIKIMMLTIKMVLLGDRLNSLAIAQARCELNVKVPAQTKLVPAEWIPASGRPLRVASPLQGPIVGPHGSGSKYGDDAWKVSRN